MSDHPSAPAPARPGGTSAPASTPPSANERAPRAPLVSVFGVFILFALFLVAVYYVYLPRRTGVFPDDGIRTSTERRKTLADLRQDESRQLATYAWVDQQAGVVRLPIERAMELTLEQYRKPSR